MPVDYLTVDRLRTFLATKPSMAEVRITESEVVVVAPGSRGHEVPIARLAARGHDVLQKERA